MKRSSLLAALALVPLFASFVPRSAAADVPVQISLKEAFAASVTVSPENGTAVPCTTPCTVQLPPGRARIVVDGASAFEEQVEVGAAPMKVVLSREARYRCMTCFYTSIGASAGSILVFLLSDSSSSNTYGGHSTSWTTIGIGAGLAAGGLALLIAGFAAGRTRLQKVEDLSVRVGGAGARLGPSAGGLALTF